MGLRCLTGAPPVQSGEPPAPLPGVPMAVTLSPEARKQALGSLKRFLIEELEVEASDLQAIALLEFLLKEIAPTVYNAGVTDAQAWLLDRLTDLEGACGEPEFGYWPRSRGVRRK